MFPARALEFVRPRDSSVLEVVWLFLLLSFLSFSPDSSARASSKSFFENVRDRRFLTWSIAPSLLSLSASLSFERPEMERRRLSLSTPPSSLFSDLSFLSFFFLSLLSSTGEVVSKSEERYQNPFNQTHLYLFRSVTRSAFASVISSAKVSPAFPLCSACSRHCCGSCRPQTRRQRHSHPMTAR